MRVIVEELMNLLSKPSLEMDEVVRVWKLLPPLRESAVDIDAKNSDGSTLLMMACKRGYNTVVDFLIDAGADVNARDNGGITALMRAAVLGHKEVVELLLDAGANTKFVDSEYGKTALVWTSSKGYAEVVRLLLNAGADKDAKGKDGCTALLFAADRGHKEVVEWLLAVGAKTEFVDSEYGRTALVWAAYHGHQEVVRLLLNAGADVNARDAHGATALMYACARGYADVVSMLLSKNADMTLKNADGKTAFDLTTSEEIKKLVMPLDVAPSAEAMELMSILSKPSLNEEEMIRVEALLSPLCESAVGINYRNSNGSTLLMKACKHGYALVAKFLLRAGADVNARDNGGTAALARASCNGDAEVVKMLLDAGADVDARDNGGKTALMYASSNGYTAIVTSLLDAGANTEFVNSENGRTALMYAASHGHAEVVKLLLDAGADTEVVEQHGRTALLWASCRGHKEVVELLLDEGGADITVTDSFGNGVIGIVQISPHIDGDGPRAEMINMLKQFMVVDGLVKLCTTGEPQEIDMADFVPEKFLSTMKATLVRKVHNREEGISTLEVIGTFFSTAMQHLQVQALDGQGQAAVIASLEPLFKDLGYKLPADALAKSAPSLLFIASKVVLSDEDVALESKPNPGEDIIDYLKVVDGIFGSATEAVQSYMVRCTAAHATVQPAGDAMEIDS